MDRLVTDNLTNRLKDALQRQIFGKMMVESQDSMRSTALNPSIRVPEDE